MANTAQINVKIDPALKRDTEKILKELGLNTSELIKILFRQVVMRKAVPFDVAIPQNGESNRAKRDRVMKLAKELFEGMSDSEISEFENAALDRAHWNRENGQNLN